MSEISEALRGPWVATVADRYGFLLDPEEIDDEAEVEVSVVRDSAVPIGKRMPGSYQSSDVLATWDGYWDEDDDMETRWEQAQAIANALNALAGSSSGGTT